MRRSCCSQSQPMSTHATFWRRPVTTMLIDTRSLSEFGELLPGSKNFQRWISGTFFVGARPNLAALRLLVRSMSYRILVNFDPLFRGAQIFDNSRYLAHFLSEDDKIWHGYGAQLANWDLFPEFRELWFLSPAIPCGDLHQSFTDARV